MLLLGHVDVRFTSAESEQSETRTYITVFLFIVYLDKNTDHVRILNNDNRQQEYCNQSLNAILLKINDVRRAVQMDGFSHG